MGQALRGSNPQLVRTQRDQPTAVNSTAREEGSLKLETHLVNLNVSVTDRVGKAIPGLKQEDFSVHEDGVPQRISFFSPEQSPFNLVLLLDLSGSMREESDLIKETATHFLDIVSPQDSVAVVTFSTDVTVVSRLTKDRDDLRESIELMLAPTGGTAFYDALAYALVEVLRKVKGQRNAVIAITDGEDNNLPARLMKAAGPASVAIPNNSNAGSFLTFEQLLDGVMEADALVYPIHLNPAQPHAPRRPQRSNPGPATLSTVSMLQIQHEMTAIARKQLQSLAEASGGRMYHADRIEDLRGVFEQVAAELRTVYSMAYSPANLNFDGRFRRIRVQLNRPDVATRTRPGYFGR
jgi:VWFA-related protein